MPSVKPIERKAVTRRFSECKSLGSRASAQGPAFAIVTTDKRLGVRGIECVEFGGVPLQLFTHAISDVP